VVPAGRAAAPPEGGSAEAGRASLRRDLSPQEVRFFKTSLKWLARALDRLAAEVGAVRSCLNGVTPC